MSFEPFNSWWTRHRRSPRRRAPARRVDWLGRAIRAARRRSANHPIRRSKGRLLYRGVIARRASRCAFLERIATGAGGVVLREELSMREQVPLKPGTAKISGDLSPKKPNTIFFPVEKARWLRCRAVNKLQAELQRRNVWCLDDGITAGSGRAIRFVRCRLRAGDMIEHMIAVDESEAAIGELHALAVDAYEFGWGCQENAADIDGGLKGGDERRNFCLRCTMAENARSGNPIGEVGRRTVAPQVAVVTPAVRRVKLRSNRFHRCNALQCAAMRCNALQ